MNEKPIWIVFGTTGEYSDRTEWPVDAWTTKEESIDRVKFLTNKIQELGIRGSLYRFDDDDMIKLEKMREFDPSFKSDYTGTTYFFYKTVLKS